MHEVSLAGGIVKLIEDEAARQSFRRVTRLCLEVGALSGVEVEALRFAMSAQQHGTVLEGALIEIETPDATAWCMDCAATVGIRSRLDACPRCGGNHLQPTGGTELRLREFFVVD